MKALIIGGTGIISTAVLKRLVDELNWEVWVINRGNNRNLMEDKINHIVADINNESDIADKIKDLTFDTVCQFIGFNLQDVERDYRLFNGKTRQYIYVSSASVYNKITTNYIINEGTTLSNPYWEYSRDKIDCENFLMKKYRDEGFPVTIVRPSHTYSEKYIPTAVHGKNGFWQVIKRMMQEKPVIIQGDGTSLWNVTFSKDFAIGYTGLMGNSHAVGEAFQITGDESLTWNQIYKIIADALGVKLYPYHVSSDYLSDVGDKYGFNFGGRLIGDKSVSVVFDNSKIKKLVPEMRTTIRFDEGIRIALKYIFSHPECQKDDYEFDLWCDRVIKVLEASKTNI